MKEELAKLGLTKNEASVYLALLEYGSVSAGSVIKKTKLHRNIVYENLEKLIEKGLVGFVTIKNIKHFEATSSKELRNYVERKKEEVIEEEKIMRKLLPEIEKVRVSAEGKQDAMVFKGKKGLKTVLEEITKTKSELLVFGTGWGMKETLGSYYEQWHLKLKLNKVRCRILLPANKKENFLKPFTRKYLPENNVIPSTIAVYGNNVLNIIWGEEPIAILIISEKASQSYKGFFELLWKMGKK